VRLDGESEIVCVHVLHLEGCCVVELSKVVGVGTILSKSKFGVWAEKRLPTPSR
jgi:hypothetical protein